MLIHCVVRTEPIMDLVFLLESLEKDLLSLQIFVC